MEKTLFNIIKSLKQKIEKLPGKDARKVRFSKELSELAAIYADLKIPEGYEEKYERLVKLGNELNEGENYRDIKKMEKFIPNCFYFVHDIKGEIKPIMKKISVSYVIACTLFLVVAFPLFPTLLTLLFLAPMYIGIRGMSKGLSRGIMVGMTVVEMAALTGGIGVSIVFSALKKYNVFLDAIAKQYHFSLSTANMFIIAFAVLALVLLAVSLYNLFYTVKYRKIFA